MIEESAWPEIPFEPWSQTCGALHLWTQMVGKYRLAHTPWVNHSWHATLYVTPVGLTTGPVHEPGGCVEIIFDLREHVLRVRHASGRSRHFRLEPMSVAEFLDHLGEAIAAIGGQFDIH